MADKLVDAEAGGESTQYESIQITEVPPSKSGGQLGKPSTVSAQNAKTTQEEQAQEARKAERVRYGQKISEEGMGGQTTNNDGTAHVDVGYGSSRREGEDLEDNAKQQRQAQGYGSSEDASREIGG